MQTVLSVAICGYDFLSGTMLTTARTGGFDRFGRVGACRPHHDHHAIMGSKGWTNACGVVFAGS
jgi:hypothetical protein